MECLFENKTQELHITRKVLFRIVNISREWKDKRIPDCHFRSKILVQSVSSFLITAKIRLIWSFRGVGKSHRELNLTEQIRRALGKLTAAFGTCFKSAKTREAIYPITLEIFHVFCYYRTVLFRQSLESEAKK